MPLVTLFFGTASATDLRELFTVFYSQSFFTLHSFQVSMGLAVHPQSLQGFMLIFET